MNRNLLFSSIICGIFLLQSLAAWAQPSLDSLHSVMLESSDVAERSKAGLRYAEIVLDSSKLLAMDVVDRLIRDSRNEQYTVGVVRAELLKSWIYLVQVNYEGALRSAYQAKEILENERLDSLEMARALNVLGLIHMELNETEEAMDFLEQSLHWLQLIGDSTRMDRAYNNLGALSRKEGKLELAISYFLQSRALRVELGDSARLAYSDFNLGTAYLKLDQLDSAGFYFNRSSDIFNRSNSEEGVPGLFHISIGEYYLAKGNHEEAISHIEKGLSEALEKGYVDRWIKGYDLLSEALYQSGRNESAYEALRKRVAIADSINEVTNTAAIAKMEARYQNAETEKRLMKSIAENLEKESQIMSMRFQNIWVISAALFLIAAVFVLYWLRAQKRKVSQAGLEAALASTKLMALKSQINSHFIFNSINTAQGFVLNSQKEKTYQYLAQFASLLRRVLENSDSDFVPLEDEIGLIKDYVEIEATRFNNKFSYELSVDAILEDEIFEIPSMIIQPFVENAITHGLINLNAREGRLSIVLRKLPQQILCEISDNGIGRERAAEIKMRKQRYYKSKAYSNVEERLRLFDSQAEVRFEVSDLYDEEGQPSGTVVKIWMPFR
ncbi:MAG: tetratricopeptide repeat protein [Bacteroidetes bacterium]|nr:MAG: tetratricopeptide repeat protein [Bacteroidota bacterium]